MGYVLQEIASDNDRHYAKWLETQDPDVVHAAVQHLSFRSDDDSGWELVKLANGPAFRRCQCGSRYHWAVCPENDQYCG